MDTDWRGLSADILIKLLLNQDRPMVIVIVHDRPLVIYCRFYMTDQSGCPANTVSSCRSRESAAGQADGSCSSIFDQQNRETD